jgi:hypothetical protein
MSSTKTVTPVRFKLENKSVVLVDCPGFDDTVMAPAETLGIIAGWLSKQLVDF